jgi:hypothetical protein
MKEFSVSIIALSFFVYNTVNEGSDVAIDLSGKLIEIYVKPLLARNIAQVGNFIKAIL